MKSILPIWLIDIATIMTIFGFILTLLVWWQVRGIKSSYRNKARLPEIHKELSDCASKINGHLNDWKNQEKLAILEMTICKGLLENTSLKSNSALKKATLNVKLKINRKSSRFSVQKMEMNNDWAWAIYGDLSFLNTLLSQTIKDSKWD